MKNIIILILVAFFLTGCGDIASYPEGIERDLEFYLPASKTNTGKEIVFFTFHNVIKYDDALFDKNEIEVWMRYGKNIDSVELTLDFEWSAYLKPRWKK